MPETLFDRMGGRTELLRFLRHFYADVRQHRVIGPIFNQRINDWPTHIAKISEFWARVTGGPSSYSGAMPARHMDLGLSAEHFQVWLDLWDYNCRRHLRPAEAVELNAVAQQLGAQLHKITSDKSGLQPQAAPQIDPVVS